MHAIAGNLTPVGPRTGIETLEADTFRLECFQTPTGLLCPLPAFARTRSLLIYRPCSALRTPPFNAARVLYSCWKLLALHLPRLPPQAGVHVHTLTHVSCVLHSVHRCMMLSLSLRAICVFLCIS